LKEDVWFMGQMEAEDSMGKACSCYLGQWALSSREGGREDRLVSTLYGTESSVPWPGVSM